MALISRNEKKVWEIIKRYPEELSFILQEKDYNAYLDTYGMSDDVILTEAEFNLVKEFFRKRGQ